MEIEIKESAGPYIGPNKESAGPYIGPKSGVLKLKTIQVAGALF